MIHLSEEDLILLYYREPGISDAMQKHLRECEHCRQAADALARTLNLCNQFSAPEPPVEFERGVWAQLAPRLENTPAPRRLMPRLWMAAAAAVMLLVCAFFLGRWSRPLPPPVTAGLSNQARERILEISLADHLDRADRLLTEISNSGDFERSRAEDLASEGRLLRQILARQGDSATLGFLDDIDRLLTEAAHASDAGELQLRIGSESLLFKVRIMESNLRTRGLKS